MVDCTHLNNLQQQPIEYPSLFGKSKVEAKSPTYLLPASLPNSPQNLPKPSAPPMSSSSRLNSAKVNNNTSVHSSLSVSEKNVIGRLWRRIKPPQQLLDYRPRPPHIHIRRPKINLPKPPKIRLPKLKHNSKQEILIPAETLAKLIETTTFRMIANTETWCFGNSKISMQSVKDQISKCKGDEEGHKHLLNNVFSNEFRSSDYPMAFLRNLMMLLQNQLTPSSTEFIEDTRDGRFALELWKIYPSAAFHVALLTHTLITTERCTEDLLRTHFPEGWAVWQYRTPEADLVLNPQTEANS